MMGAAAAPQGGLGAPSFDPSEQQRKAALAQMFMAMGSGMLGAPIGDYTGALGAAGAGGQQAYAQEIARQQQLQQQDFQNQQRLDEAQQRREYYAELAKDREVRRQTAEQEKREKGERKTSEAERRKKILNTMSPEDRAKFALLPLDLLDKAFGKSLEPEEDKRPPTISKILVIGGKAIGLFNDGSHRELLDVPDEPDANLGEDVRDEIQREFERLLTRYALLAAEDETLLPGERKFFDEEIWEQATKNVLDRRGGLGLGVPGKPKPVSADDYF
jgi:hypothetical protein